MNKKYYLSLLLLVLIHFSFAQSQHSNIDFNNDWHFFLGNDSIAFQPYYNDVKWRKLTLPHDWSIEGKFSKLNPATTQGGALPGGIGWYRKGFSMPLSSKNKNIFIQFDGVYRNSEVWINGHYLGKRPNGYIAFQYDLTPYLKWDGSNNIIAVKVDNAQQPNSRWYTGAGIYRNVELIVVNKIHIKNQFIKTIFLPDNKVTVKINTLLKSVFGAPELKIVYAVYDKNNKLAGTSQNKQLVIFYPTKIKKAVAEDTVAKPLNSFEDAATISLKDPLLWSVQTPNLYQLVTKVFDGETLIDSVNTIFGIRSIKFDREKGFFLNNAPLKIKGVCMHHDLGALGAAFNVRAAERQLQILKVMGCNAIRTSHNPPAAAFLDLCDQMGFLVMEEAFDIWKKKKNKFDYALDFNEWHKKDLEDMIVKDRNHPSVFMWSIGNEIREQFDSSGIIITQQLVDIVKKLDDTRPVTSALTETVIAKNFIYQSNALDVIGWNYNEKFYPDFLQKYPGKIFIGTETTSALATRGHYDTNADSIRIWPAKGKKEVDNVNGDWTVSAYDHVKAGWGSTHEETWKIIKKYDFLSGLFVWTGFDYLGEPTPYPWPARSSYFGIVDLAGFPKDVYYMYQSEWTNKPVLHIFPHWNWEPGKMVDVWAYYNNADEVELFLNNKSIGIRKKRNDELHVKWLVPFEAGTLKAISRKNNKVVLVKQIKTAGKPARIELIADQKTIKAGGKDLSFITAKIVDKEGNLVPYANNLISFTIQGNATIIATDNGYQADTTSLSDSKRRAWKGMALAIIKSPVKKGNSTLTANAIGLPLATITLTVVD